ncbi:hypothetical protein GCM10008959_08070 [Deinococcus seoulensis]|uniref:Integral membrane protein n=1 Tax=Deinococcus seoulensis TaxID=1837379 RepID=A0ABQ2RM97_9DEIO|nr:hypothetical protein [Deinococcus seoulensis]GGR49245.1 hypothetical protein GCM10008959_08070 [Deinococcus seoulensis]
MTDSGHSGPAPSVSTGALFLVILTFAVAANTVSLLIIPDDRAARLVLAALPVAGLIWTAVNVWRTRAVPGAWPTWPVMLTLWTVSVSHSTLQLVLGQPLSPVQWSALGLSTAACGLTLLVSRR